MTIDDIKEILPPSLVKELGTDDRILEFYNKHIKNKDIDLKVSKDILLYHGSDTIVRAPEVQNNGFTKDFGYGFYTTKLEKQAKKWAIQKSTRRHLNQGCVSIYSLEPSYMEDLKIRIFEKPTDDWLDFVANCRYGVPHRYDIVEGPMADDTIYDYVTQYINHKISRHVFWEMCQFKYPTHQLVFCTKRALSYLKYKESYYV